MPYLKGGSILTESQNLEKILKALKVVVMDVTNKMEQLEEEQNDLKSQVKNQDGEIQAISKMFNQAFEHLEGGAGIMPTAEPSSIGDDEKLKSFEASLDVTKNRIEQLQTKFSELEISIQSSEVAPSEAVDLELMTQIDSRINNLESKTLEATPSESMDPERLIMIETKLENLDSKYNSIPTNESSGFDDLNQFKTKFESSETKILAIRGKIADIEDKIASFKQTGKEAPSTDMSDIMTRFNTLEHTVASLEKQDQINIDLNPISSRIDSLEKSISQFERIQTEPNVDLNGIIKRLDALETISSSTSTQTTPDHTSKPPEHSPPELAPQPTIVRTPISTSDTSSGGVLTLKDKIITIIEEQVTTNAMKIATNLGQSTASIRSVLRQLEAEGRIVLSGDVDSNPDVKLE